MIKLKSFQETLHKGLCRPACLKIVLEYYGIRKTEKELVKLTECKQDLGIDDKEIARVAKSFGFKAEIKNNCSFDDIEKFLDLNIPVIVDWFSRGRCDYIDSEVADGHYSVVSGLDDKFIFLQDPEIGKIRKLNRDDFMSVWFDFRGKYIKENELIIRQIIVIYK